MKLRVVIADDESLSRERLRHLLRDDPQVEIVAECANGKEAVETIKATSPDLLFLDVTMPELDGFAVAETLRKDPSTASVPIIMLTGLSSQFSRYAGLESGGTDFFTKPTSPSTLVSRIKTLLRETPEASSAGPN